MVFRRFSRGRGLGYGRGLGLGLRSGYGRSVGLSWGRGFRPGLSLYSYPIQAYPQQSTLYNTAYPQQHPSYTLRAPNTYQQIYQQQPSIPTSLTATHMNCVHFNDGICTLRGISVPANGLACQSFTSRV